MRKRIILFGSDEISLPAFKAIYSLPEIDVVAVYSQPDRRSGRGQQLRSNPVTSWARSRGLVLLQPEKLENKDTEYLTSLQADLGVVMAYGQIFKAEFLNATRLGFVNFHGSLLPRFRGASPVEAAVALGLEETGISMQQVVLRLDAGPVHASITTKIKTGEGKLALRSRLGNLAAELATQAIPNVLDGSTKTIPQDERLVTYTRLLTRSDSVLDFRLPAQTLYRRILALEGWPGSTFEYCGVRIKIGASTVVHLSNQVNPPGLVISVTDIGIQVACGIDSLVITHLQKPGGRMLQANEYVRGSPIFPGVVLASVSVDDFVADMPFPRTVKV